ncbi:MAG: CDP-alcohol phosphatidyltransferase family protein [Candidatus Omnitrophota bacterium]|nr:CDP-alcohol phosphatidyltransferase family protein [Candidatus Omnitrophota bacterium]
MALNFANKVTIFRILAVPFFIASVLYYTPQRDVLRYISLGIFLLAVISDVVDGYIARTRRQKTKGGAILDPLADKILLISAFICLYTKNNFPLGIKFPLWVILFVISRDVIILLGAMIIYIVYGELEIVPTRWGKLTTFFQTASIIGILLQINFSFLIWYATVIFTAISGFGYIKKGIKVLNVANGAKSNT